MKLKKLILSSLILCVLCLSAFIPSARGQAFYNMTIVTNSQSVPLLQNYQQQLFPVGEYFGQHSLLVTNINTNTWYYLSYGNLIAGQGVGAGATNIVPAGTIITNLNASLGFTNGGNWIYTIPGQSYSVSITPYATFYPSNAPGPLITNGVSWQ